MNAVPRRALRLAAPAAVRVKTQAPEFAILHAWLDSWSGLGLIVVGMHRHADEPSSASVAIDALRDPFISVGICRRHTGGGRKPLNP